MIKRFLYNTAMKLLVAVFKVVGYVVGYARGFWRGLTK